MGSCKAASPLFRYHLHINRSEEKKKGREKEEDEETERNKRKESKKGKWYYSQKKNICETDLILETGVREILEGNAIVNLVLYTHALKIVLSGPFTCEPNTVRFVTKLCPYKKFLKIFSKPILLKYPLTFPLYFNVSYLN